MHSDIFLYCRSLTHIVIKKIFYIAFLFPNIIYGATCYSQGGCPITGYIQPRIELSTINSVSNLWYGLEMGSLFSISRRDNAIGAGVAMYSLWNVEGGSDYHIWALGKPNLKNVRHGQELLKSQYYGGYLEWLFVPVEKVHGGLRFFVGYGIVDAQNNSKTVSNFWIYKPEWYFEYNASHWLQITLGLHIRIMRGDNYYLNSFWEKTSFGLNLGMKFGWFDVEEMID